MEDVLIVLIACVFAGVMVLLMKKGIFSTETAEVVAQVVEKVGGDIVKLIPASGNAGMVADLVRYASVAVRTVEQLVKTGELAKNNATRQAQAIEIVQELAKIEHSEEELNSVSYDLIAGIVDAEVHNLPRNQA